MSTESCPQKSELISFGNGTLGESRASEVAAHLELCLRCCNTLSDGNTLGLKNHIISPHRTVEPEYAAEESYQKIEAQIANWKLAWDSASTAITTDLIPGCEIGDYLIEGVLGRGGMGAVYRAQHTRMNRSVALKVLPDKQKSNHQAELRFRREMRTIGAIDHPNVVKGLDAGEHEGTYFLAMELIEGLTLSQVVASTGPIAVATACEIIRQSAIGLDYIHQRGLLHRDLKPSNLMLTSTPSGEMLVKILDLGLARLSGGHQQVEQITSAGLILGTLEYMAPEQADNQQDVSIRSDLYALGATFYFLLTGKPPLASQQYPTLVNMLSALARVEPKPVEEFASVDRKLSRLVSSMLAKNSDARPNSAADVADQLTPYCANADLGELLASTSAGPISQTQFIQNITTDQQTPQSKAVKPVARRMFVGAAFLVLFSVVMAGVIWLKHRGGYLKIEAPDGLPVTVEVIRDGKTFGVLEVGQAKEGVWYRSGDYEVRLPASADQSIQIQDGVFKLKYGNTQTVTISQIPDARAAADQSPTKPVELTHVGKPPSEAVVKPEPRVPADRPHPANPQVTVPIVENEDLRFVRWAWRNIRGVIYIQLPEDQSPQGYLTIHKQPTFDITVDADEAETLPPRCLKVIGISLGRDRQLSNEFVKDLPIEGLSSLEFVYFDGQREITNAALETLLAKKPDLRSMYEINTPDREQIPIVQRFKKLETFFVFGPEGDVWAEGLSQMPQLKKISTYKSNLTPSGIEKLAKLPLLETLIIRNDFYRHSWIDALVKIQSLVHLQLPEEHGQDFARDAVMRFAELPNLERLELNGEANRQDVMELQRLLPKCEITFLESRIPASIPPARSHPRMSPSEARKIQEQWAEFSQMPVEKTIFLPGRVPMTFRLIPPGEFLMGSTPADLEQFRKQSTLNDDNWSLSHLDTESPQRRVQISKPFYLSSHEMTLTQWTSVTSQFPSLTPRHFSDQSEVMPVVGVSWNECQEMLQSLNEQMADSGLVFKLPTEAEWEYACRAGTTSAFYFGGLPDVGDDRMWYVRNQNRIVQPVGLLAPNAWGMCDMHGNVHEWVQDSASPFVQQKAILVDPQGPSQIQGRRTLRLMRGGSAWDPATACRSALRGKRPEDYRFVALGLRLTLIVQ